MSAFDEERPEDSHSGPSLLGIITVALLVGLVIFTMAQMP